MLIIDGVAPQQQPAAAIQQPPVTNGAAPPQSPADVTPEAPAAPTAGAAPAGPPNSPSTTTHPCSNPNISTCFHLIAEQMNKTEELLKMANETLSGGNLDIINDNQNGQPNQG